MKIRQLNNHILAKRLAGESTTASALYVLDKAKGKPQEALVVAVGSGKVSASGRTHVFSVKPGDRILIGNNSGSPVKADGEEHIILREKDVLAILEE
jgi:chaperonin GroES